MRKTKPSFYENSDYPPFIPEPVFYPAQIKMEVPEIETDTNVVPDVITYTEWRKKFDVPDSHSSRASYERFKRRMLKAKSQPSSPPKPKAPPISEKARKLLNYFINSHIYRHDQRYIELCQYIAQLEEGF